MEDQQLHGKSQGYYTRRILRGQPGRQRVAEPAMLAATPRGCSNGRLVIAAPVGAMVDGRDVSKTIRVAEWLRSACRCSRCLPRHSAAQYNACFWCSACHKPFQVHRHRRPGELKLGHNRQGGLTSRRKHRSIGAHAHLEARGWAPG